MKWKQTALGLVTAAMLLTLCACDTAEDKPDPTPDVPPSASPVVEEDPELYTVRLDSTVYRSTPEVNSGNVLGVLNKGTEVEWLADEGNFVQVKLADGQEVWIYGWYLTAQNPVTQRQRETSALRAQMNTETFEAVEGVGETVYTCMANLLNCRAAPSTDAIVLYQISFGTELTVLGKDGEFYLCRLSDGGVVYCHENYLTDEATYVELEGAVDLRVFMPTADFELLFASSNNITGTAMYPAIPLMEESTAAALAEAQTIFREDGYSIKVYDAYRPKSAQYQLYDIVQDSRFIADPYQSQSWHQLGRAIDMSLIDMATGEELEMPTPMHTFDVSAARYYSDSWTEEARKNSDYMTEVMTSVGFKTITTEWWHFQYEEEGGYMDPNLDFESLTYRPVSDLTEN